MESRRYPTDLSDDEWRCIGPHLPEPTGRGRPRLHGLRAILDALFYVLKSGCPWRLLPRDFPPWKTLYDWFRRWRIDGTWEPLNAELRERLRCRLGRNPNPSAGIVDSQSQSGPRGCEATSAASTPLEEGGREKTPFAGGHRGDGAQGQGTQCQSTRPGWAEGAGVGTDQVLAPEACVGRCRL